MSTMIDTTDDFVTWFEFERRSQKLSQSEIARRGGITRGAINKLITRKQKRPGPDLCIAIAKALDISPVIVFHKAGYFNNIDETEGLIQNILYQLEGLSQIDKEDVLDYIRHRKQISEKRARYLT